jgi:hypothetical protein
LVAHQSAAHPLLEAGKLSDLPFCEADRAPKIGVFILRI